MNLAFFDREAITDVNGTLWGSAPNTFVVRAPGQGSILSSVMLVPHPADGPMHCCDLQWIMNSTEVAEWVQSASANCSGDSSAPAHGRKSRKLF